MKGGAAIPPPDKSGGPLAVKSMDYRNLDQPLVIEDVEFEKEATTELPLDESRWVPAITQELHEQVPAAANLDYDIQIKKVDSDKSTAYGVVTAENLVIPIIIKDGRLLPLDVFIDSEGKAWPVEYGMLDSYISDTTSAQYGKTVTRKKPANALNMLNRQNAPDSNNNGIRQETPVFAHDKAFLAKLEKSKEQVEKIAKDLRANPELVATYKHNGTDGVLKLAISGEAPVEQSESDVKKDKAFAIDTGRSAKKITENGIYIIKTSGGKYYKCACLVNILGFDGKPKDYKICTRFTDNSRDRQDIYAMQGEIAGYKIGETPTDKYDYFDYSNESKLGCFVIKKDGKVIAFEPVTLISCVNYSKEEKITIRNDDNFDDRTEVTNNLRTKEYLVQDIMGRQFKVFRADRFKGVTGKDGNYYVGNEVEFKKINGKRVMLTSDPSALNAAVLIKKVVNPVTVKIAGSTVSINEPWASEDLRAGTYLPIAKTELSKYYDRESIDTLFKGASDGSMMINKSSFIGKKDNKKEYKNIPRFDTLKVAAAVDDADTVDKILSLNFLTHANIQKFVEYIPQFKETLTKIADLLLASRIGLDVPSSALRTAMTSLAETIMFLDSVGKEKKSDIAAG